MPSVAPWKDSNQYKRMCFTVNLGEGGKFEDYDLSALAIRLKASFCIAGRETGAEGRKHFQGYMEFEKKKYGKSINEEFRKTFPLPLSCHYEATMGNADQNIKYCSKEDKDPFRMGKPAKTKEDGQRTGLVAAMELVKGGAPMLDVAQLQPTAWAQYRRSLDSYQAMLAPKRSAPTQSVYLWGPTGTGKTMHAHELEPATVFWTGSFLNGFTGAEEVILFDDFDHTKMHWQTFLTMTDRYPMTINVKGGFANFAPKTIIFTSNSDPKTWYPDVPAATREAIHRRMDEYGEIRFLGTLVPKEQNILTKFLIKKVKEPEGAGVDTTVPAAVSAPPPAPPSAPVPMIIDLTEDSDDDDALSLIALKRKYAVPYKGIVDDGESDEDEGEERPVDWTTGDYFKK